MRLPKSSTQVTVLLLLVTVVGFGGWASPFVLTPEGPADYTVERVTIQQGNRATVADLYLPAEDGPVPGVVFGAGSGAEPALYSNYGEALARAGFAVLIPGATHEREPGRPIPWMIVREEAVIWERGTENYLAWIEYLAGHPRVDPSRIVVGGHSGGANGAYRAAYERPNVSGVVAIAGRVPPDRAEPLRTNLLLATGSDDSLVPPERLSTVAAELTGRRLVPGAQVGSFAEGTAVRLVVADGATHLTESYDPTLIEVTTDWARRSVGAPASSDRDVAVRALDTVLRQFASGLVGVLGATALVRRRFAAEGDRYPTWGVPVVSLLGFVAVAQTTVGRDVYHLTPMPAQAPKYVLVAGVVAVTAAVVHRTARATSRFDSRPANLLLDVTALALAGAVAAVASTQFVTFQLVTIAVQSAVVVAILAPSLAAFAALHLPPSERWLFVGPAFVWLYAAILPPYL
jgi:dienelactone hydrolase